MRKTVSLICLSVLASLALVSPPANLLGLPPQVLISGVPFISWREARKLDYSRSDARVSERRGRDAEP